MDSDLGAFLVDVRRMSLVNPEWVRVDPEEILRGYLQELARATATRPPLTPFFRDSDSITRELLGLEARMKSLDLEKMGAATSTIEACVQLPSDP